MADSNIKSKCADCIFFVEHHRMGECHRYPRVEQKFITDFCGEFSLTKSTKIEPKLIPEPVEPPPTIKPVFISGNTEPVPEPAKMPPGLTQSHYDPEPRDLVIKSMEPKKRGRPFKK